MQEYNYDRLPEHMQEAARAYIERGRAPGHFLLAVLENKLVESIGRADTKNAEKIHEWAAWLVNDIPAGAWGNHENVEDWIRHDGLEGL